MDGQQTGGGGGDGDALEQYARDRLVQRVLAQAGYVVIGPRPTCVVLCGRCEALQTHYMYAEYWTCAACGTRRVPLSAQQQQALAWMRQQLDEQRGQAGT